MRKALSEIIYDPGKGVAPFKDERQGHRFLRLRNSTINLVVPKDRLRRFSESAKLS
jgi:hypothetical protein